MLNTNTSEDPILTESSEDSYKQVEQRSFMIGRWYGQQPTADGGLRQQINERKQNGTYKVTFRKKDASGEITKDIETGQWGIVGPIYFSTYSGSVENGEYHPTDPEAATHYNAYKILELSKKNFKYQSYSSHSVYTLKKVDEKFEFPNF